MDAAHNVGRIPRVTRGVTQNASSPYESPEVVRKRIYATLEDLRARVHELQDYVHTRYGSIDNPLHIREKVLAHPIRACAIAVAAGVVCGALRAHYAPLTLARKMLAVSSGVARGATVTFGSQLASGLMSRVMNSAWRAGGE
jgi:ElaB/YqjD/DUF883 family membrane-anchored ribosome-binding protein